MIGTTFPTGVKENTQMKRILAWLPALLWMGVIFMMSAMPGEVSGEQSGRVMELVLGVIAFLFGEGAAASIPMDSLHFLIRKAAHMTEYAVLFLLSAWALHQNGARRPRLAALVLCACYAATDEWHQAFVGGRGPSIADVGIDTLGAGLALCVHVAVSRVWKQRKRT